MPHHDPHSEPPGEQPCYGSSAALEDCWNGLAATHGGRREQFGLSCEGRNLLSWSWTVAGPGNGTAPTILLLSLLHPMEWIGRLAHLRLLESLLADPGSLPAGTRILSIPDANPDGTIRVETARLENRFRWVRGNARGVDLNRNFSVGHRRRTRWLNWWPMWNPGPSACSEPETAAISSLVERTRPILALSFHSFGRWIFYPPGCRRASQADGPSLARAARAAHLLDRRYRTAQLGRWSFWFRAPGTEIDFFQGQSALAFLIEVSGGGFGRWPWRQLLHPFSIFNPPDPDPEIGRLLPALRQLIETALDPGSAD